MSELYQSLFKQQKGILVLFDPDREDVDTIKNKIPPFNEKGIVKGFLVGSSFMASETTTPLVSQIKSSTQKPVVLFPGSTMQLSPNADAVLFLSLISGRNPELLIGEQVRMAPYILKYNLEAIPTAYLLIDGGKYTTIEYVSNTRPIPADKPELVKYHCKAAEMLGFKLIYLEAGSGARLHVPFQVIQSVRDFIDLPIIVGGGFTKAENISLALESGANFVVVGTAIEQSILKI